MAENAQIQVCEACEVKPKNIQIWFAPLKVQFTPSPSNPFNVFVVFCLVDLLNFFVNVWNLNLNPLPASKAEDICVSLSDSSVQSDTHEGQIVRYENMAVRESTRLSSCWSFAPMNAQVPV